MKKILTIGLIVFLLIIFSIPLLLLFFSMPPTVPQAGINTIIPSEGILGVRPELLDIASRYQIAWQVLKAIEDRPPLLSGDTVSQFKIKQDLWGKYKIKPDADYNNYKDALETIANILVQNGYREDLKKALDVLYDRDKKGISYIQEIVRNINEEELAVADSIDGWPLPPQYCNPSFITSGFGYRNRPTQGASIFHKGIDIGVPIGTPVFSPDEGTVLFAGRASGYGYAVYIQHKGYITRYGHLSEILVRKGEKISPKQQIALSGNTGVSSGPHLHFEVRILNGQSSDGVPIDPIKSGFIKFPQPEPSP